MGSWDGGTAEVPKRSARSGMARGASRCESCGRQMRDASGRAGNLLGRSLRDADGCLAERRILMRGGGES